MHFEQKITSFDETIITNTSGKRVLLNEFHMPPKYQAMSFDLELSVKDSSGTASTFYANCSPTNAEHVVDLANNKSIDVPEPMLLSIRVVKPSSMQETKLNMAIRYQLL